MMDHPLTLAETFELLGISSATGPWCKNTAKEILSTTTGEPDWRFVRVNVRERESGCPELVISVPFRIKGL